MVHALRSIRHATRWEVIRMDLEAMVLALDGPQHGPQAADRLRKSTGVSLA